MIEDKSTEKLKKRLKEIGLIVNAGADQDKSPNSEEKAAKPQKKASKGKE